MIDEGVRFLINLIYLREASEKWESCSICLTKVEYQSELINANLVKTKVLKASLKAHNYFE